MIDACGTCNREQRFCVCERWVSELTERIEEHAEKQQYLQALHASNELSRRLLRALSDTLKSR